MHAGLKTIAKLLPPPARPRGLDRTWKVVERDIGLELPDDYEAFIDLYGSGKVASAEGWAVIWNFRDEAIFECPPSRFLTGSGSFAAMYRSLRDTEYPCPFPIYPDPEGLLNFGTACDVHGLNWLTVGSPNRWDVVYFDCDGLEFTRLESEPFSRCLLKMLRKEYNGSDRPPALEPPFKFTDLG